MSLQPDEHLVLEMKMVSHKMSNCSSKEKIRCSAGPLHDCLNRTRIPGVDKHA